MKPDCYYRFRKAPERKTLMFLESFAREYEPLHVAKKRTNQVYTYLTKKPFHILAEQKRKPAFSISNEQGHIPESICQTWKGRLILAMGILRALKTV